uniref:HAP1 N-terminal domain-containing protein n=1 Tax=Setaria digitata TaxID=48799 RepID=A0A915PTV5_9BILA
MILQKEKDLELAAKIGQSLLEQNHELQARNEFLEEALNASNETVIQLRHELQMRSSLLRFYADYDIDLDACTSGQSNSENLQRRIKRLEDENKSLKNESANMKKVFSELEENERLHISEWTKQLDAANERISNLQHLLAEKNEECGIQSFEVKRLLREVAVLSGHEKALTNEAANLHEQLHDALVMHEELTTQIVELQERYTEVMAMANTPDSLYDSLASEIEASDSGFYSAINNSKILPRKDVQQRANTADLSNKLEMIKPSHSNASNGIGTRSIATVTDPLPSDRYRQNSHSDGEVVDVPNHILAKLLRYSRPLHHPLSFLESISFSANDSDKPESSVTSKTETKLPDDIDGNIIAETSTSLQRKYPAETPLNENDCNFQNFDHCKSLLLKSISQHPACFMHDQNRISDYNFGSSNALSKTASSDSLSGYEGPKMGEPGRPGTRDLEWSIRKLNIRRQLIRSSVEKTHLSRVVQKEGTSASDESQSQQIVNNLTRMFKPWKILPNVGLFASLHDNLTQGILLRSTIPFTPPVTPIRHNSKNFMGDVPTSSSSLLEALGLSISRKVSPLSITSKRLNRSQSMRNLRRDLLMTTSPTKIFLPEQLKTKISKDAALYDSDN